MTNDNTRSPRGPAGSLNWPLFEAGIFLSARDLITEQRSRLQLLSRHNRYLHDQGVICGLWIVPANQAGRPWAIQVCPGYAIGCCGEEIEVREPRLIDVRDYLWRRPSGSNGPAYVGIRYSEQNLRPVPATSKNCGCEEETVFEHSRILDWFQLDILWNIPQSFNSENFDLCAQQIPSCPQCSDSPYVFLARINLPAGEADPIVSDHINNEINRR